MGPARTIFIGTGPFGVPALQWLAGASVASGVAAGANAGATAAFLLVGVVTSPGRPSGRDGRVDPSPVDAAARAAGIGTILRPARLRDPAAIETILSLAPDLVVLADDGRIVPPPLLQLSLGALNLHPSLLPRHRGATPIVATILAGDRVSGVTIIQMDDGIDTGPIVAVEPIALAGTETAPELEIRLAALAADLLARIIEPWIHGEIVPAPQTAAGATTTPRLRREDGLLDPGRPAAALERQVRALQPWPGTHLATARGPFAVHAASVAPLEPGDRPGTIVAAGSGLALVASDGRLVVDEAQPPGGRRMSGADLRRGRPWLVGQAVE
jgi:methionyl-tRNA formyltransferase